MPTPQSASLAVCRGYRTIASRTLSTVAIFRLPSLPQQPFLTCAPWQISGGPSNGMRKKKSKNAFTLTSNWNSALHRAVNVGNQSNLWPLGSKNDRYFNKSHCILYTWMQLFEKGSIGFRRLSRGSMTKKGGLRTGAL